MSARSPDDAEGSSAGSRDGAAAVRRGLKAVLARWVLTKRRGHRAIPPPTPHDEATHVWDGAPGFAEEYAFAAAQAGLGLLVRLEHVPGRDCQHVWVVLLRPDGAWAPAGGELTVRPVGDDRWRADGLVLDCVTPLQRWTVRYSGRLQRQGHCAEAPGLRVVDVAEPNEVRARVDLTFEASLEPWTPGVDDDPELLARRLGDASWDADLVRGVRRSQARGYVQIGRLRGAVTLGEHVVPVDAWSLRQHFWGTRGWDPVDHAYQCFLSTDDERRAWVHHTRFPFLTLEGGFVAHRDEAEAIRHLRCRTERNPGRAPTRVDLALGEIGGAHEMKTELVSELSLPVDGGRWVDLGLLRVTRPSSGWAVWAGVRRGG